MADRLRMHSFAGRMALLMMAIVIFNVVMADDATNLQITLDSSRPLTLYRAPSTFRRDARGQLRPSIIIRAERPNPHNIQTPAVQQLTPSIAGETHRDARAQQQVFKPILVTSRPFGFGSLNNEINKHQSHTTTTTSTTTTTTENPLFGGKGQPTIPFISISCTFGTSCSQIIAARQHKTPKPTFKPYSKEEIEKGKISLLSQMLQPNTRSTTTTTTARPRITTRRSTAAPTTTTTKRPNTGLRIRTTTAPTPTRRPNPVYIRSTTTTTTAAPPATKSTTKYPELWNQWRWPSYSGQTTEKSIDRFYVHTTQSPVTTTKAGGLSTWTLPESTTTTAPTTTKSTTAYQGHWLSLLSATLNGLQKNQKKPASTVSKPTVLKPVAPSNVKETTAAPAILRPVAQTPNKYAAVRPAVSKPAVVVRPVTPSVGSSSQSYDYSSSAEWSDENQNSLVWKPESADHQQGVITIRQPAVVSTHEIVSTKGNKISLITGSKRQPTPPPSYAGFPLPPEVSISSQVIGLKVKPKSLRHPPHVENVQGVQIETDGQDVNLSQLIMSQNIPRPARYLTAFNTATGRGYPTPVAQMRHFDESQWQPVRY